MQRNWIQPLLLGFALEVVLTSGGGTLPGLETAPSPTAPVVAALPVSPAVVAPSGAVDAPPAAIDPAAAAALAALRARAIQRIQSLLKAATPVTMELAIGGKSKLVDLQQVDAQGGLVYKQFGQQGRLDLTQASARLLADLVLGLTSDDQPTAAAQHLDAGLLYMVEGKTLESAAQIDQAHALDADLDAQATAESKRLPRPAAPAEADQSALYKQFSAGGQPGDGALTPGVNSTGRKRGPLPAFTQPLLSGTPEADAVMANLQLLPPEHALYDDVSRCPVVANSAAIIAEMGADEVINPDYSFNFVIVPPNQPAIPLTILPKNTEADPGPYPLPDNAPIEGWGTKFGSKLPLTTYQQTGEGDRHCLVVDPAGGRFFELFYTHRTAMGWQAAIAANWPMGSIAQRPIKFSSADAAGLPILPLLVRYDELQRGVIDHALRFCTRRSRKEFLYPASHYAATGDSPNCPAMGERLRLKPGVNIDGFGPESRAMALAMKKYGMIIADNGNYLSVEIVLDDRLDDADCKNLRKLKLSDFDVVQGYGPQAGPRAGRGG